MLSPTQLRSAQLLLTGAVWALGVSLAFGQSEPAVLDTFSDDADLETTAEVASYSQDSSAGGATTDVGNPNVAGPNGRANGNIQRSANGRQDIGNQPTPNANSSNRSQLTSTRRRVAGSNRASIPYMVGDVPGGGKGELRVQGGTSVLVEHPTFGGSRLNIAENNSPVAADRVYANYRHFENATDINVLSFGTVGGRSSLNVDTFTFGIEKKVTDSSSFEFRLPISEQLTSNIAIAQTTGPQIAIPLSDRNTTVGNLGMIYKLALLSSDDWHFSSGVALNLPTAPDVRVQYTVNDPQFPITNQAGQIGQTVALNYRLNTVSSNETVNLSPFFSAYWQPQGRLYGLGFVQVDTPLNQSTVQSDGATSINGQQVLAFNRTNQVNQQTLLRGNLGMGAWLWKGRTDRTIHSCSILSEFHYTSSLNDADVVGPIVVARDLGNGNSILNFGNTAGRVDLLNAVLGVQTVVGKTVFVHGFVAPLRSGADKAYDFEYSFAMNRLF